MASLDFAGPHPGAAAPSAPLSEAKRRLLERCREGHLPAAARALPAIGRRVPGAPVPLSHGQQLLWLHAQLCPGLPVYNEPITVHRRGALDVAALERSLREILRRHEAWRTTFPSVDGEPVQVVRPETEVALPLVDLRDVPAHRREGEALRLASEDARRPFDLAQGPLLRALLVRLADDEHRLFLTLHHIIFDGVSTYGVFLPELTALYEAHAAGRRPLLAEPAIQYGDYASWQRRAQPAAPAEQMDHWRGRLHDAPDLELPFDRTRPRVQTFRGGMQPLALPGSLSDALRALSRRQGVTLFVTLLATFKALLHRYSGQEDLVVGTVSAGRRPETQDLLGFFLNPLLLRTDLSGGPTFAGLLRRVRDVTFDALANQDVPFELLVKELRPRRDPSRNPLYQVLFSLEPPMPALPPGWNLTQTDIETGTAKLDLYLELDDRPAGIVGRFMYNTDLFDRATIARLGEHWRTLLEGVVRDPDCRLSRLPLLTEAERRARPAPVARTHEPAAAETITARFEATVAADPHRVAIREARGQCTYGELNRMANRLGWSLRRRLGHGEHRVGLLLGHGAPMVTAMLAALKAGYAYVPLDPRYPRARLEHILHDAEASLLLTEGAHLALARELAGGGVPLLETDVLDPAERTANLGLPVPPDALAYLLYTSGSTGRPKGVMQTQRNVLHFIRGYAEALCLRAEDRLTLISSCSFDAAVMDVFGALLNGATLCPIDAAFGLTALPDELARLGATIYHSTPSVFRSWTGAQREALRLPAVRAVVLGGEEALETDVLLCRKHFGPHTVFFNLAGQTESSLNLLHRLDRHAALGRSSVPLGHPVADTEVVLLGDDGEATELSGEIGIRSAHVAPGYWRQPQLTREKFQAEAHHAGRRLFRTGDRGRLLPDGSLAFQGRRDLQVKIRGVRIELGEIECVLRQHPAVRAAAVGAWEPAPGDRRLAAYWVTAERPAPPAAALRDFLRTRLPEPMVPSAFVLLDALPSTPSGKLDRRALPLPAPSSEERAFVAPRDAIEARLAAIWAATLGLERVGVADDFFDLGGHSLLAVRLFAEVDRTLGARLPLVTLLEAPTVERLARVVRAQQPSPSASLVALRAQGRRPPFFAVHGHSGEVLFYRALAQRLGPEQPFFALQAQGLGGAPAHRSIEAMAARYIEEMRGVQPEGPYHVGGYCLGALVAFEIARQLAAQGQPVALLALFVGRAPAARRRALAERARGLARRLRAHGTAIRSLRSGERLAYVSAGARGVLRAAAEILGSVLCGAGPGRRGGGSLPPSWVARFVARTNLRAARRYVPRTYPGRMTVFLSGGMAEGFALDPGRDLDGLTAREVDVIAVPGATDTMMAEPHVAVLSERLQALLAAVEPTLVS